MDITINKNGDELYAAISGQMNAQTSPMIEVQLIPALDGTKTVTLDLEKLYRQAKFHTDRAAVCIALERAGITYSAFAEAKNKVVRNNTVDLNKNVLIQSAGNINLYAGNSGTYGESVLNQGSYAEGYVTLINAGVKPRYISDTMTNNQVIVNSGVVGKAVENIDLQAVKGKVNVYKMAKAYHSENEQSALRQSMPSGSLMTNFNYGLVKVDGSLTSGQRNKLVIDISGTDIPNTGGMVRADETQSGGYTVSVTNGKTTAGDQTESVGPYAGNQ